MCDFEKLKLLQKNSGYVKNITAIKICEDWIIEQLAKGLSYAEVTKLFYAYLEENNIKVDKRVEHSIYFYVKRNDLSQKIKEFKENNKSNIKTKNTEINEKKEFKVFKNI